MPDLASERAAELFRFAVTGAAAYLVDVVVFNVLLLAADAPSVWAKVVSSAAAIAVAYVGSRWFTWPHRRTGRILREYPLFVLISVLAAGLQVLCLVFSREVLGLRSPLADNVSANVVGMAIATAFRFYMFRTVVFRGTPDADGTRASAA
ncbi:MAG: GtrA family protein [Actinomycetes bacterium]